MFLKCKIQCQGSLKQKEATNKRKITTSITTLNNVTNFSLLVKLTACIYDI
jgi:hypothetical protein